jgi:hypothetical protein
VTRFLRGSASETQPAAVAEGIAEVAIDEMPDDAVDETIGEPGPGLGPELDDDDDDELIPGEDE